MELWQVLARAKAAETSHDWLTAASAYAAAIALAPRDVRLPISRANVLWLADLPFAAESEYRRALELDPRSSLAWRGLGNSLRDLNRFEEAVEAYEQSAQCSGSGVDAEIAWACSQVRLGLEEYPQAYAEAEQRMDLPDWEPTVPGPCWGGETLATLRETDTLLIWTEQGFGDTFQYLRWIPPLLERLHGAQEVQVAVESNLVSLLREGLAWLPRPPRILAKGEVTGQAPENRRLHGPLLGLPHALGAPATSHALPPAAVLRSPRWTHPGQSWLVAAATSSDQKGPGSGGRHPTVGLVWSAGRKLDDPFTHREYLKRSLPPRILWRLVEGLRDCGADTMALQFGSDADLAESLGLELRRSPLPLDDFARTARVVSSLDLVISVDTAMAHLVGAMGHPGWVLLPWSADPRWLRERIDSPWYPSLRLFRQPCSGDWDGAITALLEAFRAGDAAGPECRSTGRTH